jgi:hypothetical protein
MAQPGVLGQDMGANHKYVNKFKNHIIDTTLLLTKANIIDIVEVYLATLRHKNRSKIC